MFDHFFTSVLRPETLERVIKRNGGIREKLTPHQSKWKATDLTAPKVVHYPRSIDESEQSLQELANTPGKDEPKNLYGTNPTTISRHYTPARLILSVSENDQLTLRTARLVIAAHTTELEEKRSDLKKQCCLFYSAQQD